MENNLAEIVTVAEKLISDEKSVFKEKSILIAVVKELKRTLSLCKSARREKRGCNDEDSGVCGSDPLVNYLSSESEIARIAYASEVMIVGEGDHPQACTNRPTTTKSLTAVFELAAVVLRSGALPLDTVATKPVFEFTSRAHSGAQVFFSKLIGSAADVKAVPQQAAPETAESTSSKFCVRTSLVDAIISAGDMILSKEGNEKLFFVFIAALQACAAPPVCRKTLDQVDTAAFLRGYLCTHRERLIKIMKHLFAILRSSAASSFNYIVEEAKTAIISIAKAVTQFLEKEPPDDGSPEAESSRLGVFDMADLLEFASSMISADAAVGKAEAALTDTVSPTTALNLLLYCVVNGGPRLRKSEEIIVVVKKSVFPACIRSSLSTDMDIFRLSVSILLSCCGRFDKELVNETSTVFRHVYFRTLSSAATTEAQKSLVIAAFQKYIEEPQRLLGLFLNYDCNTYSQSIYEEMVQYLAALSLPPNAVTEQQLNFHASSSTAVKFDFEISEDLRRKAVYTLLLITESNIQWIGRFETGRRDETNHLEEGEEAREQPVGEVVDTSGVADGDGPADGTGFLHAKKYKDSFKKFLYLFNEKGSPSAAIEYLEGSVLLLPSTSTRESTTTAVPPLPPLSGPVNDGDNGNDESGATEPSEAAGEQDGEGERARHVAQFLREADEYLDRMVLGDFFAKSFRKSTDREIFEEWIKLHDFHGMSLDEALRVFLGGFKLLGEAQIVDKTMELFASHYCLQNPGTFTSADTAFILSFSICMLNTDAHSVHVKHKMSVEGFISNNRGIDEGNDLDPNLLTGIYNRITQNEIVLRPSPYCTSRRKEPSQQAKDEGKGKSNFSAILGSIPILRHLSPLATAITDKVLLPVETTSASALRQEEDRMALKEVMDALQAMTSGTAIHSMFVTATSIEHALPMWEVTADAICQVILACFQHFLYQSETNSLNECSASATGESPGKPSLSSSATKKAPTAATTVQRVRAFLDASENREYFSELLRGLQNTVRVCCSYGNILHTEVLLEKMFEMTNLPQTVVLQSLPKPHVVITDNIPPTRLEILCVFLNLYVSFGSTFTAREWQACYTAVSLLDALANGLEGLWARQSDRLRSVSHSRSASAASSGAAKLPYSVEKMPDLWFGNVDEPPASFVDEPSTKRRRYIIGSLRRLKSCAPDLWLEKLFDATLYTTLSQLQMAHGLVQVCKKELQTNRTFSLTKLFDFISICASIASRLQWRELWADASEVFVLGGRMRSSVSLQVIEGLRLIALSYLVREELLNYCFQKEVLHPFEGIMMSNRDALVRKRIIDIVGEFIDFRAAHLASGWHVVFACLSHAAVIPEVVQRAWEVTEGIIFEHLGLLKDCFTDLIFGLTTFACTEADQNVAIKGVSYLVACGHWLQYGLDAPPANVGDAGAVISWATRFRSAEEEAAAVTLFNRRCPRVSLCAEPLTADAKLEKPSHNTKTSYHLWMSLFEGLVPIVLIHCSVRVRAHAVCSIFSLVQMYGSVFCEEVQHSLFKGMITPVISSLAQPSTGKGDATFAQYDYRLLLHLALRGLFSSCLSDAGLMSLACDSFSQLVSGTAMSSDSLTSGLAVTVLRLCTDLLPVTVGVVADGDLPISTEEGEYATCAEFLDLCLRRRQGSRQATITSSRFHAGFLHEADQMGFVDVKNSKRTSSWAELHVSPAASTQPFRFGNVSATSEASAIGAIAAQCHDTVLSVLGTHLCTKLTDCYREHPEDRMICLAVTDNLRHVALALCLFYGVTGDPNALRALVHTSELLSPTPTPMPVAANADTENSVSCVDSATHDSGDPNKEQGSEGGAGERVPNMGDVNEPLLVVEHLLLLPYISALLDVASAFAHDDSHSDSQEGSDYSFWQAARGFWERCIARLQSARQTCIDAQFAVAAGLSEGRQNSSAVCTGKTFMDVFVCCSGDLSYAQQLFADLHDSGDRARAFCEWEYFAVLTAIRCSSLCGTGSTFAQAVNTQSLIQLFRHIPSEFEELSSCQFSNCLWDALDLHGVTQDTSIHEYLSDVLQARSGK